MLIKDRDWLLKVWISIAKLLNCYIAGRIKRCNKTNALGYSDNVTMYYNMTHLF